MVNEPSVFEPLKVYSTSKMPYEKDGIIQITE